MKYGENTKIEEIQKDDQNGKLERSKHFSFPLSLSLYPSVDEVMN